MRLGTCLLPEGLTLQGAHHKLAGFCSALVAGYYAAVDNPGDGHISLVDAKKRDSASGSQSHYVGHLRFHSDDCGQHSIPVAGPVAGDGLSLRLAAHVPAGTGCATDNWGLGEFGFTFERANPDFVPSAVNLFRRSISGHWSTGNRNSRYARTGQGVEIGNHPQLERDHAAIAISRMAPNTF